MVERGAAAGMPVGPSPRVLLLSKASLAAIYQRQMEHIAAAGIDLLALVPQSWRDERGEQRFVRAHSQGYRLQALPLRGNGHFHLYSWRGLAAQLRAFRPDIVHIDEEPYNLSAWQAFYHARRWGAKTLFASWQNLRRNYPPPFRWGERWLLSGVDHALAGTRGCAAVWRAKGYRGPLTVIPQFGVDVRRFQPAGRPPERPFTVGYVGRLIAAKGVDLLLRALRDLAGEWRLRIVGSGPQRAALARLTEEWGLTERVEFTPQLPSGEMPAVYHSLDVLVLPSRRTARWQEQFGRVLTEAMACAVAVVGAESGAIPEVIGAAGLLFPEGDVAALTGRLRQLRSDEMGRKEMGERGRQRVAQHFTQEIVAAQLVAVYRELQAGPTDPVQNDPMKKETDS
ncbi:MAG: glycosyltransferase family 4 protein [Anaerolineaceae bacterium]|nr:glycosyltransferase family 4 protein [Anaerolineaceae bacterium]